ncbi:MAG TPA: hypothetical protein PLZ43_09195 [bacterium]|nr:hypothetical protein [bacterium]
MPKISYLAKQEIGFDDTEVTASQIEQKIADINTLLRGLIDEDNLLSYGDNDDPILISPSNVADMPLETRPVNHCMKFFGSIEGNGYGIYERLWLPLVDIVEKNPDLVTINGIGDKEIIVSVAEMTGSASEIDYYDKTISIEIPVNYHPLRWGDLWDYIVDYNPVVGLSFSGGDPVIAGTFADEDDFFVEMGVNKKDYACEIWYSADVTDYWSSSGVSVLLEKNLFEIDLSIRPSEDTLLWRLCPVLLCRKNP